MFEYTIEVPHTTVKETRNSLDECWDICYDLAQEYGLAEVVTYALNGLGFFMVLIQIRTNDSFTRHPY